MTLMELKDRQSKFLEAVSFRLKNNFIPNTELSDFVKQNTPKLLSLDEPVKNIQVQLQGRFQKSNKFLNVSDQQSQAIISHLKQQSILKNIK